MREKVVLVCCLLGVLPSTSVITVLGCVWGSYGNNCSQTCQSICPGNKTCDVVTGLCPSVPITAIIPIITAVIVAVLLAIAVIVSTGFVERMRIKRRQTVRRRDRRSDTKKPFTRDMLVFKETRHTDTGKRTCWFLREYKTINSNESLKIRKKLKNDFVLYTLCVICILIDRRLPNIEPLRVCPEMQMWLDIVNFL